MQEEAYDLTPREKFITFKRNGVDTHYFLREASEAASIEVENHRMNNVKMVDGKATFGHLADIDAILLGSCMFEAVVVDNNGTYKALAVPVGAEFAKNIPDRIFKKLHEWVEEVSELRPKKDTDLPKEQPDATSDISA